jgi:DNA repair photolyase
MSTPAQFELFDSQPPGPSRIGPAQVNSRPKARVLVAANGSVGDYDYTLNPYIGCSFGCSYCFAASFVADEEKKAYWGEWVDVKHGALRELAKTDLKNKSIFMSSATDPYQPLEMQTGLTRSIVEFMSEPFRQPRLTVQTRSPIVTRDIDLLKRYLHVRINMSITTDSESVRRAFEPKCASIERRFDALEKASAAGIPVSVGVCPLLPIEDPASFAARILALKPVAVGLGRFHRSDRPFTSNTRAEGLRIAEEMGWNDREQTRVKEELRRLLGHLQDTDRSFGPA